MAWPGSTDKMRSLFLKGFRLSNQGSFEDPTYLGFKIVVDFGTLPIDPEFGIPPSPLFKSNAYSFDSGFAALNPFGQEAYQAASQGSPPFHSAQSYLREREANGFPEGGARRADMIAQFSLSFKDMLENYPWFIQSIDGVDELIKVKKGGYVGDNNENFNPARTSGKTLTFNCLESLNQRMTALGELYKQGTFDADYMREVVPRNLRKFKMFIFVTEIRNFFKTSRLIANSATLTTINNFSNLVSSSLSGGNDSSGADSFDSSSSIGGGFGPNVGRIARELGVTDVLSTFEDQAYQSNIKPILVIECNGCELDFDESTSVPSKIDNGSGTATEIQYSFKVHVQRVRTKYQFPNIRQDGNFLILGDGWDQSRSSVQKLSRDTKPNNDSLLGGILGAASSIPVVNEALSQTGNLLTNLVQGAINDMINEGISDFVQPALQGIDQTLMGNVYSGIPGASQSNPTGAVFNSAQQILDQNGLGNAVNTLGSNSPNNPFSGDLPNSQTLGFGGPTQRVYPPPGGNKDAYVKVPGQDLGVNVDSSISRVYGAPGNRDSYPNSPGTDLGLPNRVYPNPEGDFYTESPGAQLGVPDRVYPPPSGVSDSYPGSPGADLGAPDRVYTQPDGDSYPTSPGQDLGVPDRVYPEPVGDAYTKVPGSDLGVPDRAYDTIKDDVYANSPGSDLGVPDRKYPGFNEMVYPKREPFPNTQLNEQVYPDPALPESQGVSARVYPNPETPEVSFEKNNRPPSQPAPVYPKIESPRISRGELGRTYPKTAENFVVEKINEQTTLNLGNMKPEDKYNASLGQFNPDENKFIED